MSTRKEPTGGRSTHNSPLSNVRMPGTPQSRKRSRFADYEEHGIVKNVRFALDENNREAVQSTNPDNELMPAIPTSGGHFVHPTNFEKVSPKKNTNEIVSTVTWCSQSEHFVDLRSPSPLILTPRRSAMKRRPTVDENGQRPPADTAGCTTPTEFRSPRLPTSSSRKKTLEQADGCLWPNLRCSNQPINQLCLKLAEPTRQRNLANYLKDIGVTKIGEFASLNPSNVEQIPHLKRPRVENAINFLRSISRSTASESALTSLSDMNEVVIIDGDSEKETQSPVETRAESEQNEPTSDSSRNLPEEALAELNQLNPLDKMEVSKTSPEIPAQNNAESNENNLVRQQLEVLQSQRASSSEINYVQFAHEFQERAAGLTNLINNTLSAIAKPKLNPVKSLRDLRNQIRDSHLNKEQCDEILDLLMDLAKDVNRQRRKLSPV